jgi:outer membrane biosynthesis protein TonB
MGMLLVSIFIIVSISLIEFLDRSEWEELEEKNAVRLTTNRAYGAYKLRTQQSFLVVMIILGICAILAVYLGARAVSFGGPDNSKVLDKSSQYVDTTQFALDMENQVDEAPPSAFNQSGANGDGLPQAREGSQEVSDRPDRTSDREPKPEKPKKLTPEEEAKAFEQSLFADAPGNAKRKEILDKRAKEIEEEKKRAKEKATAGGTGAPAGTKTSNQGNVSVTWIFSDNRKAFEDNDRNVPPPAYTCGNEVDATVKVKIKVDGAGKVVEATVISSTSENGCIKENARKYAFKSRFDLSSKESQEGTIIYRYKAK